MVIAFRDQSRALRLERYLKSGSGVAFASIASPRAGRTKDAEPRALREPLQRNNIGNREFTRSSEARRCVAIKFHGLRHTCATLLLKARTPVRVVSERLGHAKVTMTLEVYAHVLPDMQTEPAATLGAPLHG